VYFINSLSGYDIVHLYNKGLTCIRQVYWKNLLFYCPAVPSVTVHFT